MRCGTCGRFLTTLRGWDGTESYIGYVCRNDQCAMEDQAIADPLRDWEYYGLSARELRALDASWAAMATAIRAERDVYRAGMARRRRGMVAEVTMTLDGRRPIYTLRRDNGPMS